MLGALACDLLLFILNPILGWVIFALGASTLVDLFYGPASKFSSPIKKISNQFQTGLNRNSHKLLSLAEKISYEF